MSVMTLNNGSVLPGNECSKQNCREENNMRFPSFVSLLMIACSDVKLDQDPTISVEPSSEPATEPGSEPSTEPSTEPLNLLLNQTLWM